MGLRVRIKPEHIVMIGRSTVKNVGAKACNLWIDSPDSVERDDRKKEERHADRPYEN